MSNRLFVVVSTQIINGMMVNIDLMELLYFNNCIATLVWLSSALPCLKSNELSSMVKIMKVRTHSYGEFGIVI
jgi:hypothetical protein